MKPVAEKTQSTDGEAMHSHRRAEGASPDRHPPATKLPRDSVTPFTAGPGEDSAHRREWLMYKESNTHLTAAVTALVVAILLSLTAIFVRSVVAMDSKNAADGAVLELRKSLP
jgi:hypothetical protein